MRIMSAFAVIYEQTNTPSDMPAFSRMMERLSHRGIDGSNTASSHNITMGHWHFWTTPEETGERQPLALNGLPFKIVLDGRVDNREVLIGKLNLAPIEGRSLSDAALILHAYARWGEHCVEHIIGEYAFVIHDQRSGDLFCARDALGERTLFYSQHGGQLAIASEPWAAAGIDSTAEINQNAAAYYLAVQVPEDGQTLFKNVYELMPAHAMLVNAASRHIWRYWSPNPIRSNNRSDEDYAEEFKFLLEESVRCRLRANAPAGVLMSGGLDSGSVACLSANMLKPQPFTAISYVFDELKECDERQYIETITEQHGIRSIQIPGDDLWPLKDWQNWPSNPNCPNGNPFRLVIQQVYQRAKQEGLRVLLTGSGGDLLYRVGAINWFADLLSEGRFVEAWKQLSSTVRVNGWRQARAFGFLQQTGRRLLNAIPGGEHIRRRQTTPAWLTPLAYTIQKNKSKPDPVVSQYPQTLGISVAYTYAGEPFYANRYGIDVRHPYRDRRLIEFILTQPSSQLYRHGLHKHILRTAMQGILPEAVRMRNGSTPYNALFIRGVKRETEIFQACVDDPNAVWRKFINSNWLVKQWNTMQTSDRFRREDIMLWMCVSYENWSKSFISGIC